MAYLPLLSAGMTVKWCVETTAGTRPTTGYTIMYGVKEIAAHAFETNLDITSLVIPEGVEVIGYWSVRHCDNLEYVKLPYTLEELAEHCLSSAAITEIEIPGNVDTIGYGAFSGCTLLEKITISFIFMLIVLHYKCVYLFMFIRKKEKIKNNQL